MAFSSFDSVMKNKRQYQKPCIVSSTVSQKAELLILRQNDP